MRKKFIIIATIAVLVVGGVYLMRPEPFVPDNRGGDFCPKCKSANVGEYFYGLYREEYEDSAIIEAVKESRLIAGGCVVDERCPRYRCNNCLYKWGTYKNSNVWIQEESQ